MKVRMVTGVSGGRGDGTPWPGPGEVLEVDDAEGQELIAGRLAEAVPEEARPAPKGAKPGAGKPQG
jgi:hypothetical protein